MSNTPSHRFITRCIHETAGGLRAGLCQFSGTCRVAFLYQLTPQSPLFIYDPDNLLRDHEPKIKAILTGKDDRICFERRRTRLYTEIIEDKSVRIDGLLAYGGKSGSVHYQTWFTDHQPDICSPLPIIMWLKHAFHRFSHDISNQEHLYTGISGHFLKEYAFHAVRDTLRYLLTTFHSVQSEELYLQEILEAVLGISKTYEEGVLPHGRLVFVKSDRLARINFSARISDREKPRVEHFKHVRKLLQAVENSRHRMVSDGIYVYGFTPDTLFSPYITADYRGKTGFLFYNDMAVCSFTDGKFSSTTHQAKLVEFEEILYDYEMSQDQRSNLFKGVQEIIHYAQKNSFGCSLLIDLSKEPLDVSSQPLQTPIGFADYRALIRNLARVDGALHLYKDLCLYGFACLLDGDSIKWEDRSRGARYNSALRFTSKHMDTVILVVSSDKRPVATIYQGMELNSRVALPVSSNIQGEPVMLENWFHTK